jgi:hypothetical protein
MRHCLAAARDHRRRSTHRNSRQATNGTERQAASVVAEFRRDVTRCNLTTDTSNMDAYLDAGFARYAEERLRLQPWKTRRVLLDRTGP